MDADSTEAAAALTSMFTQSKEAIPDHMQDGGGANLPTHHQLLLAQMMRNTTHPSLQVTSTLLSSSRMLKEKVGRFVPFRTLHNPADSDAPSTA
jgi:hypothetical protein